jgi:hypothetical protein
VEAGARRYGAQIYFDRAAFIFTAATSLQTTTRCKNYTSEHQSGHALALFFSVQNTTSTYSVPVPQHPQVRFPRTNPSKMSVVSLLGVEVKNNPAPFNAPYEFEITFECLEQLQKGQAASTRPQSAQVLTLLSL